MNDFNFEFDKLLEHRSRLGIMSSLMVNDWLDFNTLKEVLELTDGNLASHISALEKADYIQLKKEFVGRKPRTTYSATIKGRNAFKNHLNALEAFIKSQK